MRYYPALLALFVLIAIKPVQAQTLQPNYGAPVTPVSVCNGNATFKVKIIGSLSSCATGTLDITLPPGYVYVSGSAGVTAGSGSVSQVSALNNQARLTVNGMPNSPDSTVISYQAYATCSAIGTSNNQVSYTLSTTCLAPGTVTSNTFNTQSAALNISSITNNSYSGAPGDIYTRAITITNSGLGNIAQITLADTSGSGLYIYNTSVSGGWSLGTAKSVSGTDTVNAFTLSGPSLSQGQSIIVTQTVRIMSRCFLQSRFNAFFGCNGNACTANNVNSTATAGATINTAFANSIKVLPTVVPLSCRGTLFTQMLGFANLDSVAIANLAINIFNYNGLSNGYINFRYKTGANGGWTVLTLDSARINGAAMPCITGMADTAWATIPVIKPGDTVYVAFEEQDCPITGVSGTVVIAGLGLSYRYGDACGDSIPVTTSFPRNYQRTQMSVLTNLPSNMSPGTSYPFIYNFSLANSTTYTTSGAAGSKVRFSIVLPNNIDFTGVTSDISLTSISTGLPIATPSSFSYNTGTHTIDLQYSIGSGFTINSMQNSNLTINNLTLNCAAASNGNTVVLDCFLRTNTGCAYEEQFLSQSNSVAFICPVSCGTVGGLSFNDFTVRRVNYGLPDNNNDGVPDASGTLDMTKIRTNYTLPGDTLEVGYYGKISVGPGSPAAGFKYGYAYNFLTGTSTNRLSNLYASVQLFAAGSSVPFYTCNNLAITGGTGTTRRVNFSISTLNAACPLPAGYSKFNNGDSIIVRFYYKTTNNTSTLVAPISMTNLFYISDINTATTVKTASTYTCGSDYIGNCTLISYNPNSHGSGAFTLNGGGTVGITIDNYLTLGTGIAGSKPFINEYRPISIYDTLKYTVPAGYSYVSATAAYSYTTGINASTTKTVSISPVDPSVSPLVFDINALFTNGTLPIGDQGSSITIKINISADCFPQTLSNNIFYFKQVPTPGYNNVVAPFATWPYVINSSTGTITFTPPILTPTAVTTVASPTDTASWDIQFDISSTSPAGNVWMGKDAGPGSATIFNIQQLSGPGGTVVNTITPDAGGIYQLGAFTTATSYYRVNATYTSCTKDSVQLAYGVICGTGAYPASVAAAASKDSLYLTVVAQQPALQISIVSQPTTSKNFCDTIRYELEILDAGLGSARNLSVQTTLPATGNIFYLPNTFEFQFPAGTGTYVSIPDAQVGISGNTLTFTIPAGILSHLSGTQSYRIRFGVNTSCGFVSGGSLRFSPDGEAFCGQLANGIIQQGQQIQIIGAPTTTNLYAIVSATDTSRRSCNTNGDVLATYRFKMINQGPLPTGVSDGFSIQLPAPWQLDTNTVIYPHDPGMADFTNVTGNTWYFNTGAGIIAGDSVTMTVTLRVPAAQVASLPQGNSVPIIENAVVRYIGFCSASGMPCPVSQITLNTNNTTSIYYSSSHAYYNNGPVLFVTNPPAICAPQTIDLTAAAVTAGSTAGLTFSYYTDAAGLNPLVNPATISNPGTYYIKGAGTITGCGTDTLPVTALFNYKPGITTSPDTSICKNGTALLSASSPASSIQWTGFPAGNPVSVKASGSYQVIATNAAGCKDTGVVNVSIVDLSTYLTASPNPTIQGKTVVLETTNKYQVLAWLPQSQFPNQTAATQSVVMGDSSQTFSVVLQSVNGCTDTATVRVTIDPTSFNIYVPNAFTPNSDGKNDVFYILGPTIKEIELRIFNQWGQQIFATKDKGRGWNGLFNGQPQPAGVYVYTVKAVLYNGTIITQKGTLLLIR